MNDSPQDRATTPVIRLKWLKAMYILNVVVAGPIGIGILFTPATMMEAFEQVGANPALFGFSGSVPMGFAICGALGLRFPIVMAPVLLLQITYKASYLLGVLLPLALLGTLPASEVPNIFIFGAFIVGNAIAIPFRHLFAIDRSQASSASTAHPIPLDASA